MDSVVPKVTDEALRKDTTGLREDTTQTTSRKLITRIFASNSRDQSCKLTYSAGRKQAFQDRVVKRRRQRVINMRAKVVEIRSVALEGY